MHPPRIFNAVFEPVTIRLDGPDPNRVLEVGFEFFANAAVILHDEYFLADLEARLCHEASRVKGSNFITTQDSSTISARRISTSTASRCLRVPRRPCGAQG